MHPFLTAVYITLVFLVPLAIFVSALYAFAQGRRGRGAVLVVVFGIIIGSYLWYTMSISFDHTSSGRCTFATGVMCMDYVYTNERTIILRVHNPTDIERTLFDASLIHEPSGRRCTLALIEPVDSDANHTPPYVWENNTTIDLSFYGCPYEEPRIRMLGVLTFENGTTEGALLFRT